MNNSVTEPVRIHTLQAFHATQKGQMSVPANTEVILLSDTHWYWWFIRIPQTGAEGFVPAELLELPCERLARLNSRINVGMADVAPIVASTLAKVPAVKPKKSVRFNYQLDFSPADLGVKHIASERIISDALADDVHRISAPPIVA